MKDDIKGRSTIWDQEKYIKAWNYASHAHIGQYMPGTEVPYINHIGNVAMEVMSAIAETKSIGNPDLLVQCALLHDTIEDTSSTYDDINETFGVDVADGVAALSKDKSLPTKSEQMDDSIQRILKQPLEIWMVKLSDRITNLQPPPAHWDKLKIEQYRNEAVFILNSLGEADQFLADRLKSKINDYVQYYNLQ